jgi:membrane protein implicated in regulation of membrane protease activity
VNQEPGRWLDRLVSACISVFMGALALYGAVWLLSSIRTELAVIGAVLAALASVIFVWRLWRSRW